MQGSHVTLAEEQKGEGNNNSLSLMQNFPHQKNGLPFSSNSQFANLNETYFIINSFDQPPVVSNAQAYHVIFHFIMNTLTHM